jgi:gamma-butyrobetaine dioxygenase
VPTVDDILAMLASGSGVFTDGEIVDELSHALQCATLAQQAGADDMLLVAAALHDIGYHPVVAKRFPGRPHEEAGRLYASEVFGDGVAWLIAQHVPAKRYLVATDASYAASLSPASLRSLAAQGGPMTTDEVNAFDDHPQASAAAQLRRWDDLAKVPNAPTIALDTLRAPLTRLLVHST